MALAKASLKSWRIFIRAKRQAVTINTLALFLVPLCDVLTERGVVPVGALTMLRRGLDIAKATRAEDVADLLRGIFVARAVHSGLFAVAKKNVLDKQARSAGPQCH